MKNFFFFKTIFTASILLFLLNASAQNDSITRLNRKYKTEIGVDMSQIFQRTPGTALILKLKNNRGRFVDLTSAKNYRIQFGINGSLPVSENVKDNDTTYYIYSAKTENSLSITAMFGFEKVKFYGKFNFFYGIDFGPSYSQHSTGYTAYRYSSGQGGTVYGPFDQFDLKRAAFSVSPFIGAKYRLSEHFSASIESGFTLTYFISKSLIYSPGINSNPYLKDAQLAEENKSGLELSMKYLRFLTLNYHL